MLIPKDCRHSFPTNRTLLNLLSLRDAVWCRFNDCCCDLDSKWRTQILYNDNLHQVALTSCIVSVQRILEMAKLCPQSWTQVQATIYTMGPHNNPKLRRNSERAVSLLVWGTCYPCEHLADRETAHWECYTKAIKGKGKAVPLQAWSGPEGSRKIRFPDFMTMAQDGG